jgi:hypothetical protein
MKRNESDEGGKRSLRGAIRQLPQRLDFPFHVLYSDEAVLLTFFQTDP